MEEIHEMQYYCKQTEFYSLEFSGQARDGTATDFKLSAQPESWILRSLGAMR